MTDPDLNLESDRNETNPYKDHTDDNRKELVPLANSAYAQPRIKIETKIVIDLLQNPLKSLELHSSTQWIYGVLGVAAALLGFIVWAIVTITSFMSLFMNPFSSFGLKGLFGFGTWMLFLFQALIFGLLSQTVLMTSVWLFGNRFADAKFSPKEIVTVLGGVQWLPGAGMIVGGLLSALYFPLGFAVFAAALLVDLVLILTAALEMYAFPSSVHKARMIVVSVGVYFFVTFILFSILGFNPL